MSRRTTLTAGLGGLALTFAAVVTPVSAAAPEPKTRTLDSDLLSPLSAAVSADGTAWYTENFKGTLLRRTKDGKVTTRFQAKKPGYEVGAVSERRGSVRFAVSHNNRYAVLWGIGDSGKPVRMADLMAHEKKSNPDAKVTYGFRGLDAECADQLPEGQPASYPGIVESHPYATFLGKSGTTYVADAAANAVFAVPRPGVVETVAVIPPAPQRITAEFAETAGMPACVVGETYWFESVPTDVEEGPDGKLYVTTLPGGPEDGSLGAAASVYRVARSGKVTKVAGGLTSAVGLAVARNGDIYVSELFAGRISRIKKGQKSPTPFLEVPLPGDVEITGNGMYATTHVLTGLSGEPGDTPAGRLVRIVR